MSKKLSVSRFLTKAGGVVSCGGMEREFPQMAPKRQKRKDLLEVYEKVGQPRASSMAVSI